MFQSRHSLNATYPSPPAKSPAYPNCNSGVPHRRQLLQLPVRPDMENPRRHHHALPMRQRLQKLHVVNRPRRLPARHRYQIVLPKSVSLIRSHGLFPFFSCRPPDMTFDNFTTNNLPQNCQLFFPTFSDLSRRLIPLHHPPAYNNPIYNLKTALLRNRE